MRGDIQIVSGILARSKCNVLICKVLPLLSTRQIEIDSPTNRYRRFGVRSNKSAATLLSSARRRSSTQMVACTVEIGWSHNLPGCNCFWKDRRVLCLIATVAGGVLYLLQPWLFSQHLGKTDPQLSIITVSLSSKAEAAPANSVRIWNGNFPVVCLKENVSKPRIVRYQQRRRKLECQMPSIRSPMTVAISRHRWFKDVNASP